LVGKSLRVCEQTKMVMDSGKERASQATRLNGDGIMGGLKENGGLLRSFC
jgi:hypothetical protein